MSIVCSGNLDTLARFSPTWVEKIAVFFFWFLFRFFGAVKVYGFVCSVGLCEFYACNFPPQSFRSNFMGYIWPSRDNILIRISRGIRVMLFRDFTRIKLEKRDGILIWISANLLCFSIRKHSFCCKNGIRKLAAR